MEQGALLGLFHPNTVEARDASMGPLSALLRIASYLEEVPVVRHISMTLISGRDGPAPLFHDAGILRMCFGN